MIAPSLTTTHPKGPPMLSVTFHSDKRIASLMYSSYCAEKPDFVVKSISAGIISAVSLIASSTFPLILSHPVLKRFQGVIFH